MPHLTDQGWQKIDELAQRYGVSADAVMTLLQALVNSNGTMAQFNHAELGGGGQWMRGGMTMVGDMFNHGLKSKVDGLCSELSQLLAQQPFVPFPRGLPVAVARGEVSSRAATWCRFGQLVCPRTARPCFGPMVASGTGLPERKRRAEPGPLCLFQPSASAGRGAERTRDRLRHARPPDRRRLSAAGKWQARSPSPANTGP